MSHELWCQAFRLISRYSAGHKRMVLFSVWFSMSSPIPTFLWARGIWSADYVETKYFLIDLFFFIDNDHSQVTMVVCIGGSFLVLAGILYIWYIKPINLILISFSALRKLDNLLQLLNIQCVDLSGGLQVCPGYWYEKYSCLLFVLLMKLCMFHIDPHVVTTKHDMLCIDAIKFWLSANTVIRCRSVSICVCK